MTDVVPAADLAGAADALARTIASKSALVIHTTKAQVDAAVPVIPEGVADVDADVHDFGRALRDPESREVAARYTRS